MLFGSMVPTRIVSSNSKKAFPGAKCMWYVFSLCVCGLAISLGLVVNMSVWREKT